MCTKVKGNHPGDPNDSAAADGSYQSAAFFAQSYSLLHRRLQPRTAEATLQGIDGDIRAAGGRMVGEADGTKIRLRQLDAFPDAETRQR